MKRVLILDANQRSALATTRSLGHRGVPVVTADETPTALAGCSRYSQHYHVYPSPMTRAEDFIADLSALVASQRVDVILPMTELTTELLLQYRKRLPAVFLPITDLPTIEALSDKCALIRLAKSLSVPVPATWFVENAGALLDNLHDLPYPLVLKPCRSWQQIGCKWSRAEVRFAESPEAVHSLISSDPALQTQPFMLQECVPGTGQGVFALYVHGTPVAFFSHRRLREKPPWGGVSVLSESVSVDATLLDHARSLLDAVAWHGVAMVEFKVAPDGTPYLMEVNTRLWGSLQLAIDAGVDFPWLLYQIACGEPVTPPMGYRTGRRLRWVLGDLDSLYISLRDKRKPLSDKLSALGAFFWPAPLRTRHEINRWYDMGPFWWELKKYVRDLRC